MTLSSIGRTSGKADDTTKNEDKTVMTMKFDFGSIAILREW